jgi:hypothetical protein
VPKRSCDALAALQIPNPKLQTPNKGSNTKFQNGRTKSRDLGERTIEAVPLGSERLNFTWDLGIGIWNFWNDSQIDRLKIRLKLDLFTTNSAVQGL